MASVTHIKLRKDFRSQSACVRCIFSQRHRSSHMFRGIAAGKRPKGFERPKDYVPVALHDQIALQDRPFWKDLPDILQAQVLVAVPCGAGRARR